MRTYWLTISSFFDNGHASAAIMESGDFDTRPENTVTESRTRRCDVWRMWWESYEDAAKYVAEVRNGTF